MPARFWFPPFPASHELKGQQSRERHKQRAKRIVCFAHVGAARRPKPREIVEAKIRRPELVASPSERRAQPPGSQ